MNKSVSQILFDFTSTFEFELFVFLIMDKWGHPHADVDEYKNEFLEQIAEVLRSAIDGEQHIATLPSDEMNLVAAAWYVEQIKQELPSDERIQITVWCNKIRSSLPSCFCATKDLF